MYTLKLYMLPPSLPPSMVPARSTAGPMNAVSRTTRGGTGLEGWLR